MVTLQNKPILNKMKELILENIGTIFYLVGCLITFLLFGIKNRKKFDLAVIIFVALSWVTLIFTIIVLADKHYKSIEK